MKKTTFLLLLNLVILGCQGTTPAPEPAPDDSTTMPLVCPAFVQASSGLPRTGEWRTHPSIGDVNGDGLGDIAVVARKGDGPKVFLSDGLGNWTAASEGLEYLAGFSCGIGTRLADLDTDGHLDLVVADHCKGVLVYRGDGGSTWTDASRGIPTNMQGFNDADVGDVDGDGILDIVALSGFSRGFLYLKGNPDLSWQVVRDTGLPATGGGFELRLVDLNGDDRLDVVTTFIPDTVDRRSAPPPPTKVWMQGPRGQFHPAGTFPTEGRFYGLTTWSRPDRPHTDILFGLAGARSGLYLFNALSGEEWADGGRIDEPWFGERPGGFVGLDTKDVNGDGCADLVVTEAESLRAWLALGDCKGQWNFCPEDTLPMDDPIGTGWGVAIGDLNGDGRMDIVAAFGAHQKGSVRAWFQVDGPDQMGSLAHEQGPEALRPPRGSGFPTPAP